MIIFCLAQHHKSQLVIPGVQYTRTPRHQPVSNPASSSHNQPSSAGTEGIQQADSASGMSYSDNTGRQQQQIDETDSASGNDIITVTERMIM